MKVKQIIALVVVIALLMTGSVLVTFAYLTSTQSVQNVFTVGNITMKLDEAIVNESGKPMDKRADEGGEVVDSPEMAGRTEDGNTYHLVPGGTYLKDPTATIGEKSDDCYVRMKVTVSNYEGLKAAFPYAKYPDFYQVIPAEDGESEPTYWFLLQSLTPDWNSGAWECVGFELGEGATATYVFNYVGTAATDGVVKYSEAATELEPLFKTVKIPENVDSGALANIAGLTIDVVANAMQKDGFNNASEAWSAFDIEMASNPENG